MKKSVLCIILCLSLLLSAVQAPTVKAQDPPEDLSFHEYPQDIIENHFEDLPHRMFGEDMPENWHHNHHFEEPIEREFIPPTEESLRLTQEQVQAFDCATVTDVPQTECEALVALYESTNGAGWKYNTNWLTTTTVEDWWEVYVSDGHVISVALSLNNLTGRIPKELSQLSAMWALHLHSNQLSGSIPPELGQIRALSSLKLNDNQLSGSIPKELGQIINLQYLYLQSNQLSGGIPKELGQLRYLRALYFYSNQLSGNMPPELGQLKYLKSLDLSSNQISGSIPPEIGQLSALLQLDLSSNRLIGSIPSEMGQLTNLIHLSLSHNNLWGDVPISITNLVNLCVDGQPEDRCYGEYRTDLGNNLLNVPQPNPPSDFLFEKDPDWDQTQGVKKPSIHFPLILR